MLYSFFLKGIIQSSFAQQNLAFGKHQQLFFLRREQRIFEGQWTGVNFFYPRTADSIGQSVGRLVGMSTIFEKISNQLNDSI